MKYKIILFSIIISILCSHHTYPQQGWWSRIKDYWYQKPKEVITTQQNPEELYQPYEKKELDTIDEDIPHEHVSAQEETTVKETTSTNAHWKIYTALLQADIKGYEHIKQEPNFTQIPLTK